MLRISPKVPVWGFLTLFTPILAFAQEVPPTPSTSAPAPTEDPPLTLDDSIRLALKQHGDPDAAALSFEAARQGVTSARAANQPEIAANFNYDLQNTRGNSVFLNNRTNSDFTSSVALSQNLFDGGRTHQQVNQAKARAVGAAGSYGNARNSLAYRVATDYFEQLRQEKLVTQREGQVALAQKQLEAIQAQIEAGTVARVDAQTAEVTLAQARFDLATSRNSLGTAQTNFRNIIGFNRGPALRLAQSPLAQTSEKTAPEDILTAPLPDVPEVATLDTFVGEANKIRPDLLQARASVQTNEAATKLAQIERRPQVSASAGYDVDPRNTGSRGLTLGVGLSIPIFDAGGRKADVKAAQANLESSRVQLAQLEKDVAADVEATFVNVGGEVERIRNARVLVSQARVNLENATEKYRLGLGTILDITNAQTQLFNAQTSLTSAVYDYELARSNLDRAVGRFAWADPGQTPPAAAPATLPAATATVAATQK